jgi:hypothetical protein
LIWTLEGSRRLSGKARELLRDPENEHWVSAASVWEIAIKTSMRKLALSRPMRELEKGHSRRDVFIPPARRRQKGVGSRSTAFVSIVTEGRDLLCRGWHATTPVSGCRPPWQAIHGQVIN